MIVALVGAPAEFVGPGETDQSGHGVSGGGAPEGETESGARTSHSEGGERQTGRYRGSQTTTPTCWRPPLTDSSTSTTASFSPNQVSELESEKQHLSEAVASLQERAQSHNEARVREVEAENQQLHQSITDTSSRLASLETQLKLASEEAARLRERAGRCEEVEREAAKAERSRDALNREVTRLSQLFLRIEICAVKGPVCRILKEARLTVRLVLREAFLN